MLILFSSLGCWPCLALPGLAWPRPAQPRLAPPGLAAPRTPMGEINPCSSLGCWPCLALPGLAWPRLAEPRPAAPRTPMGEINPCSSLGCWPCHAPPCRATPCHAEPRPAVPCRALRRQSAMKLNRGRRTSPVQIFHRAGGMSRSPPDGHHLRTYAAHRRYRSPCWGPPSSGTPMSRV